MTSATRQTTATPETPGSAATPAAGAGAPPPTDPSGPSTPPPVPAAHPPGALTTEQLVRRSLRGLAGRAGLSLSLLMVTDHRTPTPTVFDVPVSAELAGQLLDQVTETAAAAAEAELRVLEAGFAPGPAQWVYGPVPDGSLAELDALVLRSTHRQYDRGAEFGPRNLLALRVSAPDGSDIARIYQGFSPDRTLTRGKRILAVWNGEQFGSLDDQPLVIDRTLRLFAFDGTMVAKTNNAYEALFGPLPDLRKKAAATFDTTLGKLPIVGAEELRTACESDINMMRKLVSIQHRMDQPGYPDSVDLPGVLAFLERNPHIAVPVDTSGGAPALVFQPQAQQRWTLLKLLDDDFLRSDLTNINYEANSKSELPREAR